MCPRHSMSLNAIIGSPPASTPATRRARPGPAGDPAATPRPGRGPRRPPAAVGDGAGRVHQTPQTRSSDERRARASIRWAECRAFEAEPAGEAAATLARGPRLTGTALRTDTELANGSRSIKPQWPCNRERNRARSHRPFHEERVRPRRLSEPGRPVTEGASDSNPVNGFRGGRAERVPPFALWDWRRFPSVHAGAKTLSKTAANRIYRRVRKLIASHVGLHSGSWMVS